MRVVLWYIRVVFGEPCRSRTEDNRIYTDYPNVIIDGVGDVIVSATSLNNSVTPSLHAFFVRDPIMIDSIPTPTSSPVAERLGVLMRTHRAHRENG